MNRLDTWKRPRLLVWLIVAVFVIFLYTFLHEGGHALVGMWAGGTITNFNVSFWDLSAHVDLAGSLTPAQTITNNLAGAGLPLTMWLVFMLLVPKRANFALESLKVVGSLVFLSTLLAWIGLPLLVWAGKTPSDDAVNFLHNSGLHPLWVSLAALVAFVCGWLLFRARIDGLRAEIDLFRRDDGQVMTPAAWLTIWAVLGLFVLCALIAFGANGYKLSAPRADPFRPPAGYTLVRQIDLAGNPNTQAMVYTFTLERPTTVGVYLLIEGIDTPYFEVRLNGPEQYDQLLVHGEGYTAARDNPHMTATLQPGTYRFVLTSQPSPGRLSIYINR